MDGILFVDQGIPYATKDSSSPARSMDKETTTCLRKCEGILRSSTSAGNSLAEENRFSHADHTAIAGSAVSTDSAVLGSMEPVVSSLTLHGDYTYDSQSKKKKLSLKRVLFSCFCITHGD